MPNWTVDIQIFNYNNNNENKSTRHLFLDWNIGLNKTSPLVLSPLTTTMSQNSLMAFKNSNCINVTRRSLYWIALNTQPNQFDKFRHPAYNSFECHQVVNKFSKMLCTLHLPLTSFDISTGCGTSSTSGVGELVWTVWITWWDVGVTWTVDWTSEIQCFILLT